MAETSFNHDKLRALLSKAPKILQEIQRENQKDKNKSKEHEAFDEDSFVKSCLQDPPVPDAQHLVRIKAEERFESGDDVEDLANTFLLNQAQLFQHTYLGQMSKRINRKLVEMQRKKVERSVALAEIKAMERQRDLMKFNPDLKVSELSQRLPKDWTVVQISLYNSFKFSRYKKGKKNLSEEQGNPNLVIIRLGGDYEKPVVRVVKGEVSNNTVPYLKELQNILKEQTLVMNDTKNDRRKHWNLREKLNQRLKALVKSMETSWLGSARSLLLGQVDEDKAEAVHQLSEEVLQLINTKTNPDVEKKLAVLLSSVSLLTSREIFVELSQIFPGSDADQVYSASTLLTRYGKSKLDMSAHERGPVILILDPEIQQLPWESMPSLVDSKQRISRIPSLQFLSALWQNHLDSNSTVLKTGVVKDFVFYVLNPDKNLPNTQERLEGAFSDYGEGLSGEAPKPGQLAQVLGEKDAFIYCGHGGGSKYISTDEIEKLHVRVVPVLLGCSSGELFQHGRNLEPLGMPQSYLAGSSPAFVGFLWPVTDLDLDNWTIDFLQYWLTGQQPNLLQAVADKRSAFKQFVNAAALVAYGLPVHVSSPVSS